MVKILTILFYYDKICISLFLSKKIMSLESNFYPSNDTENQEKEILDNEKLQESASQYKTESKEDRQELQNDIYKSKEKKSLKYAWKNEVDNFKKNFWLETEKELYSKVLEIQKEAWLVEDWIIWPATLKVIYEDYYSEMDDLPLENENRLKFVNFLREYPKKNPRNLPLTWLENPYSKKYFYWDSVSENIKWTTINYELFNLIQAWEIEETSDYNWWNSIELSRLSNWKYYLAMYINWKLSVLTYASPGSVSNKTPDYSNWSRIDFLSSYYISWSYPKRKNWVNGWAIMPMAYEVDSSRWIYWHVWLMTKEWSKWCIRAPWFYQQAIFENLKKHWEKNFKFRTIWEIY